jgi:PAS domain S-box-containing protein
MTKEKEERLWSDRVTGVTAKAFRESDSDSEELTTLRANLFALLENTDACILFSDRSGRPIFFNSNYARVMYEALGLRMAPGIQPHQLLPEAEKRWWDGLHRRVLNGEQFTEEYCHSFPDGSLHTFEIHFQPVRIEGRIAGFSEVTRDITARKEKENRLRVQRKLAISLGSVRDLTSGLDRCLRNAIEIAPLDSGGIYLLDANTGDFVLSMHKGLKEPFVRAVSRYPSDFEPARTMKQGRIRVFHSIDPEMPMAEHLLAEGLHSFCSIPFQHEKQLLGCINLGAHAPVRISDSDLIALEAVSAQIGGVISRLKAEEALRESEEHLRSVLESAQNFAVYRLRIDPSARYGLRVLFVSPSVRELMGVAETMSFETWFAHLHPEDRDRIVAANRAAFDTCRFDEVMRIVPPGSDEPRWIHAVSTGVRDADGVLRYVNGIMIDISERKRIEYTLSERERQLESESKKLQDVNIALRVLLQKRQEDQSRLESNVLVNIHDLILPHLDNIEPHVSNPSAKVHLDIVRANLQEIISPFARTLRSPFFRLTPAEIEVAHLVRQGYRTKEIGVHLRISPKTVEVHRLNIRKKLGIAGKKANLRTHLLNLE